MLDVLIIGGSFAGLSAALQLGRARRSVRVLDTGLPRNRFAAEAHSVLALDGMPPLEILKRARSQMTNYRTVELVQAAAVSAEGRQDGFTVTDDQGHAHSARRIILAHGIRDVLPAVPGMAECWGKSLIHCPYCHGFEHGDKKLGLLYSAAGVKDMVGLISDWSADLTYFANGNELTAEDTALLADRNIPLVPAPITGLLHESGNLHAVRTGDGPDTPLDALFIHPKQEWSVPLPQKLGCAITESPYGAQVEVDDMKQTSVPGIFAAGDLALGHQSATTAIYEGMMAGVAAHRSLIG